MPKSNTTWKKGQSGNPHGRPTRARALTTAICDEIEAQFREKGVDLPGNRLLAKVLVKILHDGEVVLPGGTKLEVSGKDYLDFAKWLVNQIDGPPRQEVGLYQYDELDLSQLSDEDLLKIGEILEPVINSADTG